MTFYPSKFEFKIKKLKIKVTESLMRCYSHSTEGKKTDGGKRNGSIVAAFLHSDGGRKAKERKIS
jgi:hypothetical protein